MQRLNGGHNTWFRVRKGHPQHNRRNSLQLYVPSRSAIVLVPFEFAARHPSVKLPPFEKTDPDFAPYLADVDRYIAREKALQQAPVAGVKVKDVVTGVKSKHAKKKSNVPKEEMDLDAQLEAFGLEEEVEEELRESSVPAADADDGLKADDGLNAEIEALALGQSQSL